MANAELWRKRVADWRASGLSAAEYCKSQEFTTGPLYRWSSRLAEAGRSEAGPALPLVRLVTAPAPVEATPRAAQVIIEVQGARVLVPPGADMATVEVVLDHQRHQVHLGGGKGWGSGPEAHGPRDVRREAHVENKKGPAISGKAFCASAPRMKPCAHSFSVLLWMARAAVRGERSS